MKPIIPKTLEEAQKLHEYVLNLSTEDYKNFIDSYRLSGHPLRHLSNRGYYSIFLGEEDGSSKYVTYDASLKQLTFLKDGGRHRTDGPAVIDPREIGWWYEGFLLKAIVETWYNRVLGAANEKLNNPPQNIKKFLTKSNIPHQQFIDSLIEFLWQNGYQFVEYLHGSNQIDPKFEDEYNKVLAFIESNPSMEEGLLSDLKDIYITKQAMATASRLKDQLEEDESDRETNMEILANIDFINFDYRTINFSEMYYKWKTAAANESKAVNKLSKLINEILREEFPMLREQESPDYVYHVTYYNRLGNISDIGLRAGQERSLGGRALDTHAGKGIFLTDESGVRFWYNRAADWANHHSDNTLQDELVPVVLRVDVNNLEEDLGDDEVGTSDSRADAYIYKRPIPSNLIEIWDGSEWVNVENYDNINLEDSFDEEIIEDDDGEEESYFLLKYDNPLMPSL